MLLYDHEYVLAPIAERFSGASLLQTTVLVLTIETLGVGFTVINADLVATQLMPALLEEAESTTTVDCRGLKLKIEIPPTPFHEYVNAPLALIVKFVPSQIEVALGLTTKLGSNTLTVTEEVRIQPLVCVPITLYVVV